MQAPIGIDPEEDYDPLDTIVEDFRQPQVGRDAEEQQTRKIQLSLGTWYYDKRSRKKKYMSLSGKVYSGSEGVKRSRYEKYSSAHPSQLMRSEFLYCMQSISIPIFIEQYLIYKQLQQQQQSQQFPSSSSTVSSTLVSPLLQLQAFGLPTKLLQKYLKHARIKSLFPWQLDCLCIESGAVLAGKRNLVYSAPTSGGKTLVAELLMLRKLSETMQLGDPRVTARKTIFFIVPFIALSDEKSIYFREIWSDMSIGIKTYHNEDGSSHLLGEDVELVICTIERANILLNQLLEEKREKQISMIIIDEIHLLSDPNRGFLLEVMLTKVRYILKDEVQIVGMSATLPNIQQLATWLDAALYVTDYRPVQLDVYVARDSLLYRVKKIETSKNTGSAAQNPSFPYEDPSAQSEEIPNTISDPDLASRMDIAEELLYDENISNDSCKSLQSKIQNITVEQNPVTNSSLYQQVTGNSTASTLPETRPSSVVVYEEMSSIPKIKDDQDGFKSLVLDTLQKQKTALIFCNSKKRCEVCGMAIVNTLKQQQQQQPQLPHHPTVPSDPAIMMRNPYHSLQQNGNQNNTHFQPPYRQQQQLYRATNTGQELFQTHDQQLTVHRKQLIDELLELTSVGVDSSLIEMIQHGIAFHHAGLTNDERTIVEKGFRLGYISILCTTSTLSAGVNLPAHRVIIRSLQLADQYINVATFRQMCGRAGRTGLDCNGEAIIILSSGYSSTQRQKEKEHCEHLLTSELEPLISSLPQGHGGGIEKLLLEMITCGRLTRESSVMEFIACTLMYRQFPFPTIKEAVEKAMIFLKKEQFILQQTQLLSPSPFGRATTLSGIAPKDATYVLQSLLQAKKQLISLKTGFHLLYLITPITTTIVAPDWNSYETIYHLFEKEFGQELLHELSNYLGIQVSTILSFRFSKPTHNSPTYLLYKRFYITMILFTMIQEWPIVRIANLLSNSITRGQLQLLQRDVTIYCGMIIIFCEKCNWIPLSLLLKDVQIKLSYGIANKELMPLMKIGKEMTLMRARYLLEKYEIKNAVEIIELGESRLREILIEMAPFHHHKDGRLGANYSNEKENGGGMGGAYANNQSNKLYDSCSKLAKQIIGRARDSVKEELRRQAE